MVIAAFLVTDKANQVKFFQETFLVANVSLKIVLRMLFFTLNDANVDFLDQELRLKTYITKEAFLTTRRIELIDKKEFAAIALGSAYETYIVHVGSVSSITSPSSSPLTHDIHLFCKPQISSLIAKETPTKVFNEYINFVDVFSSNLASKLPKHTGINDYTIKLVDGQQPPYKLIYSLNPVELETLKAYIKTNLANKFIKPSKFPAGTPILFDQKSDDFLQLCINHRGLNNFTIKNQYPLLLIEKLLDKLGRARQFTQLDLTCAYHQMKIRKRDK